jgi:regulator of sigma E protease
MKLCAIAILFSTKFLPLVYALIGFGLLITIHECGHFLFCKLFGIHTPTFSIGMGPTVFKRKIGKTNFRVALVPIGGYVEIAGMAEVGQGKQEQAQVMGPESFASKPYWQKFLVLIGGILFNILFAYAAFSAVYMIGMPVQKEVALVVSKVKKSKSGKTVELAKGDMLLEVGMNRLERDPKKLFPSLRKIGKELHDSEANSVKLGIERDGRSFYVDVPIELKATHFQRGLIDGISLELKPLRVEHEKYPFFKSIVHGVNKTHEWVGKVLSSLKMLVTKRNIKDFGGPIMILSESFKSAQRGLVWLFVFLAIISINLAVINILPIGALDGGQLLFETIEAVIRRKIPSAIRLAINLASWVLILSLILFLSYQDIRRFIFGR